MLRPAPHRRPLHTALPTLVLGVSAIAACATAAPRYDLVRCPAPTFDIAADTSRARTYSREHVAAGCVHGLTPHAKKTSTIVGGKEGPDVIIYPLRTVHVLDTAELHRGRLVAAIKMIGGKPWPAIGLRSKGNVVYVWLKATRPIDTTRTSGVDSVGTAYFVPDREDAPIRTGTFVYEFHPRPGWASAHADTRLRVAATPGGNGNGNGDAVRHLMRMLQSSATTSGWLTCEYGCCVAEMPAS